MLLIAVRLILLGFLARSWVLNFIPAVNAMERFTPPGQKQRRDAIGATKGLPKALQSAFDPADHFEPIPAPGQWNCGLPWILRACRSPAARIPVHGSDSC
jgi:hypothetical protein